LPGSGQVGGPQRQAGPAAGDVGEPQWRQGGSDRTGEDGGGPGLPPAREDVDRGVEAYREDRQSSFRRHSSSASLSLALAPSASLSDAAACAA
jgi:hypothetical protein